jgi:hypothetical protein
VGLGSLQPGSQKAPGSFPRSGRSQAADFVGRKFDEPNVAIRSTGEAERRIAASGARRELGYCPARRNAPDLVSSLGEPDIAVRPTADAGRKSLGARNVELGDRLCGTHSPDLVQPSLCEPMLPSGPRVMPNGSLFREIAISLMAPLGVMRPILLAPPSVK